MQQCPLQGSNMASIGQSIFYVYKIWYLLKFIHFFFNFLCYSRGAAIVVDSHYVPDVYSRLHFNPLCFLQYENQSQSPQQWENVSSWYMYTGTLL